MIATINAGGCPGCHQDLAIEDDELMPSGYALACENPLCSEYEGCWPAPVALVQRLIRTGELEGSAQ